MELSSSMVALFTFHPATLKPYTNLFVHPAQLDNVLCEYYWLGELRSIIGTPFCRATLFAFYVIYVWNQTLWESIKVLTVNICGRFARNLQILKRGEKCFEVIPNFLTRIERLIKNMASLLKVVYQERKAKSVSFSRGS